MGFLDKTTFQHALGSYDVVFDAVYTPKVTRLLREAKECGVTTVSGLEMFVRQALKQFELFTGLPGTFFCIMIHNMVEKQPDVLVFMYLYSSRRNNSRKSIEDVIFDASFCRC